MAEKPGGKVTAGLASLTTLSCGIRMGTSCFPTSHHLRRQPLITAEEMEDGREQSLPKGTHSKAGSHKKNEIKRGQRQRKKWRQVKDRQTRKPAPVVPDSLPICLTPSLMPGSHVSAHFLSRKTSSFIF